MRTFLSISTIVLFLSLSAQNHTMLVYDLENHTLDSFEIASFDTSIKKAETSGEIGSYSQNIANLERNVPATFKYPDADYSLKIRASSRHDINDYPIRTSGRLFKANSDSSTGQCSGNMISPYHYLTAAHCVKSTFNFLDSVWSDTLLSDSFFVCPAFDNGVPNSNFGQIPVKKIYLLKKYKISGEDIAICELAYPIGYETGWIGFGFTEQDTVITNHINYKFAYPGFQYNLDTFNFNGDSLYYYHGKVNVLNDNYIGVRSGRAIPGESGSSIIVSNNTSHYTSYGCLTFAHQQTNSRINNYEFYAFKDIINGKLVNNPRPKPNSDLGIYPNPSHGKFQIRGYTKNMDVSIYDALGRAIPFYQNGKEIELLTPAFGLFYVRLKSENGYIVVRYLKG